MRAFKLHTKDVDIVIVAKTRKAAFGRFFKKIVDKEISLDKIGNLVMLTDRKEEYPFRTVPSLFLLGIMDEETAIANIKNVLECNEVEAGQMLYKNAEQDQWIVKEVTGKPLKHFPPFPEEGF